MLNIFRTYRSSPLTKITFFHNPNSTTSINLLSKLNRLSELPCTSNRYQGTSPLPPPAELGKFAVDLRESKLPTYDQYTLIHDFLAIHPENALSFEKVFPVMFDSRTHTLCKKTAANTNRKQKFLGDLEVFNEKEYEMISQAFKDQPHNKVFNAPLVVDWENSLIATDDKGLDRIMANYLSCGMQDSHTSSFNLANSRKNDSVYKQHGHVHPHVAEFADLY